MRISSVMSCLAAFLVAETSADNFQLQSYMDDYKPECLLPLDVMFLQDTTESYTDDLPNIVRLLPDTIKAVQQSHPNSYFGVSEFKDRPQEPYGWPKDYCFRLASDFSAKADEVTAAYKTLYGSGGDDLPEDSYLAGILAFQWEKIHWRPLGREPQNAGARLVILGTDALPHFYDKSKGYVIPNLPLFNGINQDNINDTCSNYQYPTPEDFAAAVLKVPLQYVLFLVPDNDIDVLNAWKWVNDDLLHQEADFVQTINSDSTNFVECILKALESVTKYVCEQTTTEAPTTETTTTTTIPTTTTTTIPTTAPTTETIVPTTMTEAPTTVPTTETTTTTTIPTTAPTTETTVPTTMTEAPTTAPTMEATTTTTIPTTAPTTETMTEAPSTVPRTETSTPTTAPTTAPTTEAPTTVLPTDTSTRTTKTETSTPLATETPRTTETPTPTETKTVTTGTRTMTTTSHTCPPCPNPCPKPCPNPCPRPCPPHPCPCECHCCHDDEVIIEVSDRPVHIEAKIEYKD